MSATVLTYRGKTIKECSIDELIGALYWLGGQMSRYTMSKDELQRAKKEVEDEIKARSIR